MLKSLMRFVQTLIFFLSVITFSSCTERRILILADPYIKAAQGGSWAPATILFRLSMLINGFTTEIEVTRDKDEIIEILPSSADENIYRRVIISPWNLKQLQNLPKIPEGFIMVGGNIGKNLVGKPADLVALVNDRRSAMIEVAEIAAQISISKNLAPLFVFHSSTDARIKEKEVFQKHYQKLSPIVAISKDIEDGNKLPTAFQELVKEASLMVLFAGIHNINAMEQSEETETPVITENIHEVRLWKKRLVASVEPNERHLRQVLLKELKNPGERATLFFDSHIIKGDIYKLYDQ